MTTPALAGRVAVVTGGSRGIGAGIAASLAAAGASVAILARDPEAGSRVASRIGGGTLFVAADVTDEASVERAVDRVHGALGLVDVLVNDAGLTPSRQRLEQAHATRNTATDISLDLWRRYLDVNVTGTLLVSRSVLPLMLAKGRGAITTISSVGAMFAMPGDVGYAASKAALSGLTRSMAVDYAPTVRVNEVLVGSVPNEADNPVHRAMLASAEVRHAMERSNLVGRCGEAADIGAACVFLCSDAASFITGQSLVVDGGAHVPVRVPYVPDPDASEG